MSNALSISIELNEFASKIDSNNKHTLNEPNGGASLHLQCMLKLYHLHTDMR